MIEAKPVIQDEFWILRTEDRKIGTINAIKEGYSVKINDGLSTGMVYSETLQGLKDRFNIKFVDASECDTASTLVYGYPTNVHDAHDGADDTHVHNPMWDMKQGLPLYTKKSDSQCWYAAGYYNIDGNIEYCPKLIILQRNDYSGPFYDLHQ